MIRTQNHNVVVKKKHFINGDDDDSSDLYGTLVLKSHVSLYLLIFPSFHRKWQIHDINQNILIVN
jgi:hypothetical protein